MKKLLLPAIFFISLFGVSAIDTSIAMDLNSNINIKLVLPDTAQRNSQLSGDLKITNTGNSKIELVSPHYNAALNFVVFDKYWNMVSANPTGKVHVAQENFSLLAGQTNSFKLVDLTFVTGTSRMGYKLVPGIYYILAIYHPGTTKFPDKSSYPLTIASNIEKITVY